METSTETSTITSTQEILNSTLLNIDKISENLDKNKFIENARKSFKEGIDDYDIAEDEKAKLIANYEAQISVGLITETIKLAKDLILTDIQIKESQANIDLKAQQKASMLIEDGIKGKQALEIQANIDLKAQQKASMLIEDGIKQKQALEIQANIKLKEQQTASIKQEDGIKKDLSEQDINIKKEQVLITKEQVLGEKVRTQLGLDQIISERYRHRDLQVEIAIKVASNEVTKQNAKFEEARRFIALQSNNQNTFMKKADYYVQQLQAIAQDDQVVISAEQIGAVKDAIEAIPTNNVTYSTEVNVPAINVDMTKISALTVDINGVK